MGLVESRLGAQTERIISEVQSRWVWFAKTGRPTQIAGQWPVFRPETEPVLDFSNSGPVVRSNFAHERIALADALMSAPPAR
jgi:carboxylesterase type B